MSRQNIMQFNSSKLPVQSYMIKGDYLMAYSRSMNTVLVEKFDFSNLAKTVVVDTKVATELFPEIWNIESNFDKLDYVLSLTNEDMGTVVPITEGV